MSDYIFFEHNWQIMSNSLLFLPKDSQKPVAKSFTGLSDSGIFLKKRTTISKDCEYICRKILLFFQNNQNSLNFDL